MPTARGPRPTLRRDAAAALQADSGWHARLAARRIGAVIDEALAPLGLGSQQFSLLCLIASADDDTFGALAERAGLNASTMTRNIDVLARAGWVEVAQHGSDRRRRAIWLTEAGARLLQAALPVWRRAEDGLQARLGNPFRGRLQAAHQRLKEDPP